VEPATLQRLGMVFVPITVSFAAIAISILMFYDIDRSRHQRNLELLRGASEPDSEESRKTASA